MSSSRSSQNCGRLVERLDRRHAHPSRARERRPDLRQAPRRRRSECPRSACTSHRSRPRCIVGMTGSFGQCCAASRSSRSRNAGVSGDGGLVTGGSMTVSFTLSPASCRRHRFDLGAGQSRENAAVDDGARQLRQRVVRVSRFDPRRDAGRAQLRVVEGRARQACGCRLIRRHGGDGAHVDRRLPGLGRRTIARGTAASASLTCSGN